MRAHLRGLQLGLRLRCLGYPTCKGERWSSPATDSTGNPASVIAELWKADGLRAEDQGASRVWKCPPSPAAEVCHAVPPLPGS